MRACVSQQVRLLLSYLHSEYLSLELDFRLSDRDGLLSDPTFLAGGDEPRGLAARRSRRRRSRA